MTTTHHMVVELLAAQAAKKRKDAADLNEAAEAMETGIEALRQQACINCLGLGYEETNRTERIGFNQRNQKPCLHCDGTGFYRRK